MYNNGGQNRPNNNRPNNNWPNNNRPYQQRSQGAALEPVNAEPLPEDYVQRAEEAILKLKGIEETQGRFGAVITTSKLRSLFSLFAETYNEVVRGEAEALTPAQVNALSAAKVRVYYEIGREEGYRNSLDSAPVGRFVKHSRLLEYLYDVGDSCDKLIRFYQYMEALVAFHRYYFGEKKDFR